jgi:hypothetical protein
MHMGEKISKGDMQAALAGLEAMSQTPEGLG